MDRSRNGLTLAEVVLATGILAVIALSVIGLFSKLLSSGVKSADQAAGRALAEKVLDRAMMEGPPDWGVGPGSTNVVLEAHDDKGTSYTYTVSPVQVTAPKASLPMGEVYRVQVEVYWWNESHDSTGSRADMGKLWTKIEQFRYIE